MKLSQKQSFFIQELNYDYPIHDVAVYYGENGVHGFLDKIKQEIGDEYFNKVLLCLSEICRYNKENQVEVQYDVSLLIKAIFNLLQAGLSTQKVIYYIVHARYFIMVAGVMTELKIGEIFNVDKALDEVPLSLKL